MKKLILIAILIVASVAWAADLSFTITFTIPSAKVDAIRTGYLKAKPVPTELSDPNDPDSEMVPTMTDKEWILSNAKAKAKDHIMTTYSRGVDKTSAENKIKSKDAFTD